MTTAFEQKLFEDLPRGFEGKEDESSEARWAAAGELDASWTYSRAGVFLGYLARRGIGRVDDRHILTVAGSRSGKGVSLVIPNLLLYEGSILALDPKGELARITKAERERKGQRCVILDPFNANRRYPSSSYNPLAEIDPASPEAVDDAALIADSLVVEEHGGDNHWTESAKLLLRGLILHALCMPPEERNLVTVRRLLMLAHPTLESVKEADQRDLALFYDMTMQAGAFNGVLAATGQAFLNMRASERQSVLSTARTQTGFLDSKPLQDILQGLDFRVADLKHGKTTLYLCLPASRMATHAKWFRVIINLAMTIFEREATVPTLPVLMVLDEFPILGHMQRIETAAGQIASFGVKLWTILQDLTQIQRLYKESWETFVGNAGVLTFFGNADMTTLKYISEKLGSRAYKLATPTRAGLSAQLGGAPALSENLRVDPLLAPHEVERLLARETERLLVLTPGSHPVILQRATYHSDPAFAGMFTEANPNEQGYYAIRATYKS